MFAIALAVVPLLAQLVAADCTRYYTVQPGDICDSISAANSVSTYQLAVVNADVINPECTNLDPGCQLCLGWPGEDCTTTYVVKPGDTCDGISSMSNINETIFSLNNPQLDNDCDNLYVGEVVCIANSVTVPPAPNGTLPGSSIPPTASPALPYCDE